MQRAVQEVITAFGGLDIIVNRQDTVLHTCGIHLCDWPPCPVRNSQPPRCCLSMGQPSTCQSQWRSLLPLQQSTAIKKFAANFISM